MPKAIEPRLIIFDMDGTLIAKRFIFQLAHRFSFEDKLRVIMSKRIPEYERTRDIASLLKGLSVTEIVDTFDQIPLSPGAETTVESLKRYGHILAIISDSYTIATERLKKRLDFDYTIANELVLEAGKATGKVKMPLNWPDDKKNCLKHAICKLNAMLDLSRETGISPESMVAVGDNVADICMLEQVGLGIAFNPKTRAVEQSADVTVRGNLEGILAIIRSLGQPKKP